MWIFDSYYKGSVHIWARENGLVQTVAPYPQFFYLHLKDPPAHAGMIEALESLYRVEEAPFATIYGRVDGYRIFADRSVAEKIEKQTHYSVELYNVDVRRDQQYMAGRDLFPCGERDECRFAPDFDHPLRLMQIEFSGDLRRSRTICSARINLGQGGGLEGLDGLRVANDARASDGPDGPGVPDGLGVPGERGLGGRPRRLEGSERAVLSDLLDTIRIHDPDVILAEGADLWMQILVQKAVRFGLDNYISRSGRFRSMAARSYWSYGRANHRDKALIPEGRLLIDTASSFAYREGGLKGILLAARLSGLSPNLTARFTPGTLISSYEVFEALRRGLAVPFRKSDAEGIRDFSELKSCDRGGMMLQPEPRLHERVSQIDFTSLYPSIIVKYNLSPETIEHPERRGFLAAVISPLLNLRIETKRRKKLDPDYAGIDSILKWMLVTCFGYTGYRNAKFGQIEVHERITAVSRELLMQIKEIAEGMGFEVLHGIVDCLWVKKMRVMGKANGCRGDGGRGYCDRGESVGGGGGRGDGERVDDGGEDGGDGRLWDGVAEFKEAVERETGILTEVDTYDWIVFLPMADGLGAYNRYFGRLCTGKVKVRGIAARRRDTPQYVASMQNRLFELLAGARERAELLRLEPAARQIRDEFMAGLPAARPEKMVIRRRVGRLNYSRRCAEASAIKAYEKLGLYLSPGMEMGYVVADAGDWEVQAEENASSFDLGYYAGLLEKAWQEVAFVFR